MDTNSETTAGTAVNGEVIASYQVFAMPDANQAESLANYLTRHGSDAVSAENEVTCPTTSLAHTAQMYQLLAHWRLFWRYSEKELYGLPVYAKPACKDHQQ